MTDLSRLDPTGRFSGLADIYARHRPDYPPEALAFILTHCQLQPGSVLVDVGSGTGISSRQFAQLGLQVIGIEPNAEMRGQAQSVTLAAGVPPPVYRAGRAEATGLADGSADAVLAAQAFHWFDLEAALREFQRILKPAGWAVLLQNERDESDPFTAAYGAVQQSVSDAAAMEQSRQRSGEPLQVHPLFQNGERVRFNHEQVLDEEGLLGRALSVSYAPRDPGAVQAFKEALQQVFARFQQGSRVVLRYQTTVVVAQRR
jgi:SAM-dependent methyltransferase